MPEAILRILLTHLTLQQPYELVTIIKPVLHMRELGHRLVK